MERKYGINCDRQCDTVANIIISVTSKDRLLIIFTVPLVDMSFMNELFQLNRSSK